MKKYILVLFLACCFCSFISVNDSQKVVIVASTQVDTAKEFYSSIMEQQYLGFEGKIFHFYTDCLVTFEDEVKMIELDSLELFAKEPAAWFWFNFTSNTIIPVNIK